MKVLEGIKVVELASWVFVPAAGAVLAEWGADVIKIEDPLRPDPQRHLVVSDMSVDNKPFLELMHQANRGKRSIGIDLSAPAGMNLLAELVGPADVFLTNLLPQSRRRLRVDVEDIRRYNSKIIYARGSGYGPKGADSEMPGFDGTTYYARGGVADSLTPAGAAQITPLTPAMGDLPGAVALAGAIAAALLRRERTGETPVVDVSLLNVAMWGAAPGIIAAAKRSAPLEKSSRGDNPNSLTLTYRTSDYRYVKLSMFQSDRYFGPLCEALGAQELGGDPRFSDHAARQRNRVELTAELDRVFGALPLADIVSMLADLEAPWSVVQSVYEVGKDPQALANGYLQWVDDGLETFPVTASPWQFDESRHPLSAAPEHGGQTEEILLELGHDWDEMIALKESGVIL